MLDKALSVNLRDQVDAFVPGHCNVFREDRVKIQVGGYDMLVIDTGDPKPIAVRTPHYGLHKPPIMQKTIDKLLDLSFIKHAMMSCWRFHITLGPKHHQESVMDIVEYIWSFCINYMKLNMMTIQAKYWIPCYDDVFVYGFEGAVFFILLNKY